MEVRRGGRRRRLLCNAAEHLLTGLVQLVEVAVVHRGIVVYRVGHGPEEGISVKAGMRELEDTPDVIVHAITVWGVEILLDEGEQLLDVLAGVRGEIFLRQVVEPPAVFARKPGCPAGEVAADVPRKIIFGLLADVPGVLIPRLELPIPVIVEGAKEPV